jgi:hypothetical protein
MRHLIRISFPYQTSTSPVSESQLSMIESRSESTKRRVKKIETCHSTDVLQKNTHKYAIAINPDQLLQTIDTEAKQLSRQVRLDYILKHHHVSSVILLLNSEDQGLYAVASNYGSILIRLLFQPMENAASLFYASKAIALQNGIF